MGGWLRPALIAPLGAIALRGSSALRDRGLWASYLFAALRADDEQALCTGGGTAGPGPFVLLSRVWDPDGAAPSSGITVHAKSRRVAAALSGCPVRLSWAETHFNLGDAVKFNRRPKSPSVQ